MSVVVQVVYTVVVSNILCTCRPEVIAALQVVRQERNGDMNIPLTELVKDTERLLSKNKNILKPASLTARAKVGTPLHMSGPRASYLVIQV